VMEGCLDRDQLHRHGAAGRGATSPASSGGPTRGAGARARPIPRTRRPYRGGWGCGRLQAAL